MAAVMKVHLTRTLALCQSISPLLFVIHMETHPAVNEQHKLCLSTSAVSVIIELITSRCWAKFSSVERKKGLLWGSRVTDQDIVLCYIIAITQFCFMSGNHDPPFIGSPLPEPTDYSSALCCKYIIMHHKYHMHEKHIHSEIFKSRRLALWITFSVKKCMDTSKQVIIKIKTTGTSCLFFFLLINSHLQLYSRTCKMR